MQYVYAIIVLSVGDGFVAYENGGYNDAAK